MKTDSICFQLALFISVLFQARRVHSYDLDSGVTFRAKTSYIEYRFNTTSAFPGAYFRLEFSTTSCKGDLLLVTSRDTKHFYRISLEGQDRITFYYKLEDGEFDVQVSLPGNKTFCDGRKHTVEFRRYLKIVSSKADDGPEKEKEETKVMTVIFSKPDKIVLGGMASEKFDGCMYSAIISFYWQKDLRNISVNLIERYLKGDRKVRSAAVFVGACPGTEIGECTRSSNNNSMMAKRGVIASPRAIESSKITRCVWSITAPSKHRLKLTLLFYNVSGFVPSCFESQVIVFDGKSSASDVLGRFCYPKSNTVIYTRGNHMAVDMHLPKGYYLDFIAVYQAVGLHEGPCPTNRSLNGMSGSLMSPNFPNNYEFGHECSWIISVPRGYHVLLSFNRTGFHVHSCNKTCDCDFLEVRDGTSSKGKLLGKYCGDNQPSPIYASDRHIWLRFVSDKRSNNKGFHATFQAIKNLADECPWNKTLTSHRGYINSPLFALDYPGNMQCTWLIHVPKKHRVAFVFLEPIGLDANCTDVLEIRDGLDSSSPLLKRYCGSVAAPPNVFSSGRDMYVQFRSDKYIHRGRLWSGFQATYFAERVKSGSPILKGSVLAIVLTIKFLLIFCYVA